MKVKIWGARGSIPAPLTSQAVRNKIITMLQGAQGVDLSDPMAVLSYVDSLPPLITGTAGGNTSCVELQAGGQTIIIDAGTGIRLLSKELMAGPCGRGQGVLHLFLSHTHWDHIQGLPFFRPAFVPGNRIYIYSVLDVAPVLMDQMKPAAFPVPFSYMQATFQFVPLVKDQALTLDDVRITHLCLAHPGDAYAYRFEHGGAAVVYATDAEYKHLDDAHVQPFVRFCADADVLIFDAQYSLREAVAKEDWGHSSGLIGIELAQRAGVKRLVLFHHDADSSDADLAKLLTQILAYQAAREPRQPCEVMLATEGLTIDLALPGPFNLHWPSPDETAILTLGDGFDQRAVEQVLQAAETSASAHLPRLVVDLTDVTQLTITCLRALLDLQDRWQGRPLALACLSSQARHVLELINCLDCFPIYPNVPAAQAALEAREVLHLPSQIIGDRYRIEAKLGENNLGVILEAIDTRLNRPVTIQVLSTSLSQAATHRLLREAQKLAPLQSPHMVMLFDCGEDRGLVYLVMERVGRQTLRDVMGQEDQPPPLDIAVGILRALEYVHGSGIAHGHLTPESVLLEDGIKLKDFEFAWLEQGQPLTESSNLLSDPHYLAPEQIQGQGIDARTDLYALGVILYELFTGRRPFEGSQSELLDQHLYQSPTPPRQINSGLSRSLEYLILKLLAKQPEQRYATAAQVRRVLLGLTTAPESAAGGTAPQRRWTLVGRDVQLESVLALWDSARRGQGQIVMIAGEAGVGKTRLVEEVAAQVRDAAVFFGHCSEMEGSPPYQPFVEIARNWLASVSLADLHEQLGDTAPVMATLVPEIHHLIPDLLPLAPLRPDQEQLRLMHSFTRFVGRASAARPWLLILEDLHWADQASLQLLHHLARHAITMSLLIVGTYRDVELEPRHPLHGLLQSLSRSPAYRYVSLDRLDQDAVRLLLEQIWQPDVPEAWVTAIYQHTGGNPFYVQEVAKGLSEEGAVTCQDGVWRFAPIGEVKLPQSVRDIVLRRVARARPATQEMLRRAAVLGEQFNLTDLLAIEDEPEDQALESLDEALERRLIREMDPGAGLGFCHTEIQQVIYEDMSLARRRALHRRIATALEQRTGDVESMAEQLARHFTQAGDCEKGFVYSLQAAERAVAVYAYQTALIWYNQVRVLLPEAGEANTAARRARIYDGLGLTLRLLGRYDEAIEAYTAMRAAAEEIGDAVAQARACNGLAYVKDDASDFRGELEMVEHAEEIARAITEPLQKKNAQVELAFALFRKGWAFYRLGDWEKALALGEQALALSTGLDARYEMAESLNLIAMLHTSSGRYEQGDHYCQRALAVYREMGNLWRVASMLNNMGEVARLRGDYRAAKALYEEALTAAQQVGFRIADIMIPSNLGGVLTALGNHTLAELYLRQVIAVGDKSDSYVLAETWRFLAEACLGQGQVEEALAAAQQALAIGQEIEVQEDIAGAWRALGMVAAELEARRMTRGTPLEAASCFATSLRIYTQVGAEGERARALRAWAQYESRRGHREAAQKMRQEAQGIFARLGMNLEVERTASLKSDIEI